MELKQSATGTTLLAIEDYNSNAVTSVSDGNEKRMLVSTRIAFAFFTHLIGTGALEISGTATVEFVGGRKLMTLQGASDRITQEDGEASFELEVNFSLGEEPTAESSSVRNYCTLMSSTMLLAFAMIIH